MVDLTALRLGLEGQATTTVGETHLATTVGSGNAPVFASPMMIALMEAACVDCVDKLLPAGHQSLGMHLNVTHKSPTPLGRVVTAKAALSNIDGRKLTFAVSAHDGVDEIGAGEHIRVIVDSARFLARLDSKRAVNP